MADRLCKMALSFVLIGSCVLSLDLGASSAFAQGTANSAGATSAVAPTSSVGDQAADIEGRLIDLQVQLATERSLRGATGGPQVAAIEDNIRRLSREFAKLSGRPASIRAGTTVALAPGASQNLGTAGALRPNSFAPIGGGGAAVTGNAWGATTVTRENSGSGFANQGELRRYQVFSQCAQGQGFQSQGPQGQNSQGQAGDRMAAWGRPASPAPNVMPQQPRNSLQTAPKTAALQGADEAYQSAYSYLLQQDYGAAETAFREFLSRHSSSALVGNAQYWLGETHYVQGEYREAAVAFLKGFEKYGDGSKGADSLLKLGLSLARLNQKGAACSSLSEVKRRYAGAPRALLDRASREAARLSCPK